MGDAAETIGTMATAGLVAQEIERARAGAPAVGHVEHEPCANCGTVRAGPYCHACGQAGHVHRTPGALVHDIAHGVFHFEGKLWATLPLLVRRPGELTYRYAMGERAKFVSPMALFLFSVFLLFTIVSNLAGHGTAGQHGRRQPTAAEARGELAAAQTKLAALRTQRAAATDPGAIAGLDARIHDQTMATAVLGGLSKAGIDVGAAAGKAPSPRDGQARVGDFNTGWSWLDRTTSHAADNPELLFYKLKSYAYKYSWALIPISLPFIWLLFAFRRDVGLYDHAIFATYSLSFMSLGVVVLALLGRIGMPSVVTVLAVLVVPPLHMYRQLKGAYRLGRFGALWRTVALLLITAITSGLFATLLFYLGTE